ncbi:hypothetical protein GCM10011374_41000 [Kocuria dechangensis]|uniref:Uncharacterized protein n=1 Tax=Kocuria dechangensis TaxID=1176249 RepID=A0A917M251_9MICC|nr:hypothetical protein [Kocuria dechangensis]GGG72052.1 hypothetical protein GCM10011374_41000 [Kocuria dechangensis]
MSVCDVPSSAPDTGPVRVSPGIGVGLVFDPTPSVDVSRLSRYRMRADRPGLDLRAGESVLCAAYEPAGLGLVVLVRCEADGHSPGALIPVEELEYLGPAPEPLAQGAWSRPGTRI